MGHIKTERMEIKGSACIEKNALAQGLEASIFSRVGPSGLDRSGKGH